MYQKFSLVLMVVALMFTLGACTETDDRTDTEILLAAKSELVFDSLEVTEDITMPAVAEEGVTVTWTTSNATYLDTDGSVNRPLYYQSHQNVSLTAVLERNGITVTKAFEFTVLKDDVPENLELNTDYTDALAMDFVYENQDFIANGVGEVTLVRCVDGDTAHFTEGGSTFSVRFLGINTPESTAKFEPWGKAASDYTCDKLENATQIVLQADPASGRMDSYNERWLAWVWYDGRLLNLELVEQALTKPTGGIDTFYGELLFSVGLEVQYTDLKVWGEEDPDFDYSREGIQITIEELVTNPSEYVGKKVAITGIVTRSIGGAAFIQQGDFGIYVYNRSWSPHLSPGNELQLSGLTVTYYPDQETGALQVSGYQARENYSELVSSDNTVTPLTIAISDITDSHVGSLLRVEQLRVDNVYGTDESFTVIATGPNGDSITLRKSEDASDDITKDMFEQGATITIVAPLSRYNSNYQLMLSSVDDITIEE